MTIHEFRWWLLGVNLLTAVIMGAVALPMIRRRVPMNYVYGARFPKAFKSDDLWYRINEHAGRVIMRWSVVIALLTMVGLFVTDTRVLTALACAPMLYLVGCLETYLYARKL